MNNQQNFTTVYAVGDIIQTKEIFGTNVPGSVGIVYETYPDTTVQNSLIVSVILTNGHDIGCFTAVEQIESLIWLGRTDLTYAYVSPGQLMTDFRNGIFQPVFGQALSVAQQHRLMVSEV